MNAIALQSLMLFLRIWECSCGKSRPWSLNFKTRLGMQARVDEFVEQYTESTKRVIDWECSDVKKHERDFVENAEALAWHEENVATDLHRELQQARMQVYGGSGLAGQQQRRLESVLVEPMPECLGTLRTKAASMVPYLNESCKSLSDMSSGPHGQTSAPAHEFSSAYMCNEVCYKFCSPPT